MTSEDEPTARQASIGPSTSRFGAGLDAAVAWLTALLLPCLLVFDKIEWAWWLIPAELGIVVIMVPAGFAFWFSAVEAKADTKQLLRAGRPAVAEVVAMKLVDDHDGAVETAVLKLRIGGDDVPPFEATYRCPYEPILEVGAQLDATVDPSDNLFTLKEIRVT